MLTSKRALPSGYLVSMRFGGERAEDDVAEAGIPMVYLFAVAALLVWGGFDTALRRRLAGVSRPRRSPQPSSGGGGGTCISRKPVTPPVDC